jgi:tRNA pseudouridine38-40 synthase
MPRLKARIAYDGTDFHGWQIQREEPTVQSVLEKCLEQICGKHCDVTAAGRTDSGVHAFGQIAHFDWDHHLTLDRLVLAMNAIVPFSIRVLSIEETDPKFHARFDALSKTYVYRIDRNRIFDPFHFRYALHYHSPLDEQLIQQCLREIRGEHDFKAFQASGSDVVTTVRMMHNAETFTLDENFFGAHPHFLCFRFHANGFLRKMVRFLTGTILEISSGSRPPEHLKLALTTGERKYVGIPAAARGLFLERVYYEPE